MRTEVTIAPGVCGFETKAAAVTADGMNVEFEIDSPCKSIQELAGQLKDMGPINAYMEVSPQNESAVLSAARGILVKKGCCEACVVPAALCKAMQVATGLALPKDVTISIRANV